MRTEQIAAKALEQVNNDRYVLANMIFKRVKQLNNGAPNLVGANIKLEKLADVAMREIAEGKLVLERIDNLD
ncbi:DNA-directed RNA polymerase subunit omega [Helicobacter zhangjianzhongii]|uniref:DNA-directed RNA polymerase subunit omega n=1 Tax=Helicobacter zhangjianzhongii TaxID=2974574 RepID=A0ACC6FUB9_9HELI|nr:MULTISPECIES: DNA-directed RNA polymerase subunit omega [unclassified Helicobacter]MDL0080560.1 DNA-directed RNA polymerase subunit omega [Helicobacter sp. CPD2-1]MDL0082799.1 DNA-directed RNA polymerase subunit omega [Helicobacter sp. XJK30-2]